MSIEAIGAVSKEVSKADASKMMQVAQAKPTESAAPSFSLGSGNSIPVAEVQNASVAQGSSQPGFASDVMSSVFNEVETLASKVPQIEKTNSSPVDDFKAELSPKSESISAMEELGTKDQKMEAVSALSKTFDHAVFMAMVNQVISGVSDTSRTLIKQS